jgi:hypothetical protein
MSTSTTQTTEEWVFNPTIAALTITKSLNEQTIYVGEPFSESWTSITSNSSDSTESKSPFSFDTNLHSVANVDAKNFWSSLAVSFSQIVNRYDALAASDWSTIGDPPQRDFSATVWTTLLVNAIGKYAIREPERDDIIQLITDSLPSQKSQNAIKPNTLLCACAVGYSIAEVTKERPHIYSAPGHRVVVDCAPPHGRVVAMVADTYVHVMGTLDGNFQELSVSPKEVNFIELESWMSAK